MTNKEIQEMAGHRQVPPWVMMLVQNCIEKEREACAQIAETAFPFHCEDLIRARGKQNGTMD